MHNEHNEGNDQKEGKRGDRELFQPKQGGEKTVLDQIREFKKNKLNKTNISEEQREQKRREAIQEELKKNGLAGVTGRRSAVEGDTEDGDDIESEYKTPEKELEEAIEEIKIAKANLKEIEEWKPKPPYTTRPFGYEKTILAAKDVVKKAQEKVDAAQRALEAAKAAEAQEEAKKRPPVRVQREDNRTETGVGGSFPAAPIGAVEDGSTAIPFAPAIPEIPPDTAIQTEAKGPEASSAPAPKIKPQTQTSNANQDKDPLRKMRNSALDARLAAFFEDQERDNDADNWGESAEEKHDEAERDDDPPAQARPVQTQPVARNPEAKQDQVQHQEPRDPVNLDQGAAGENPAEGRERNPAHEPPVQAQAEAHNRLAQGQRVGADPIPAAEVRQEEQNRDPAQEAEVRQEDKAQDIAQNPQANPAQVQHQEPQGQVIPNPLVGTIPAPAAGVHQENKDQAPMPERDQFAARGVEQGIADRIRALQGSTVRNNEEKKQEERKLDPRVDQNPQENQDRDPAQVHQNLARDQHQGHQVLEPARGHFRGQYEEAVRQREAQAAAAMQAPRDFGNYGIADGTVRRRQAELKANLEYKLPPQQVVRPLDAKRLRDFENLHRAMPRPNPPVVRQAPEPAQEDEQPQVIHHIDHFPAPQQYELQDAVRHPAQAQPQQDPNPVQPQVPVQPQPQAQAPQPPQVPVQVPPVQDGKLSTTKLNIWSDQRLKSYCGDFEALYAAEIKHAPRIR